MFGVKMRLIAMKIIIKQNMISYLFLFEIA